MKKSRSKFPHVPPGAIRVPNPRRDVLRELLNPLRANRCGKDEMIVAQLEAAKRLSGSRIGRNAPCPCGAKLPDGKPRKFKACCMAHGDSLAPPPGGKGVVVNGQGPRPAVRGQGKAKRGEADGT